MDTGSTVSHAFRYMFKSGTNARRVTNLSMISMSPYHIDATAADSHCSKKSADFMMLLAGCIRIARPGQGSNLLLICECFCLFRDDSITFGIIDSQSVVPLRVLCEALGGVQGRLRNNQLVGWPVALSPKTGEGSANLSGVQVLSFIWAMSAGQNS